MGPAQGVGVSIRDATSDDAAAIAAIYNRYVLDTTITFEEEAVTEDEMRARIAEVQTASLTWLVATDERLLGFAYASKWKGRCAYRFSAEVTVYLDEGAAGRGLGSRLYAELFERLRAAGMHSVLAGIALPNESSVALHEKMGMEKVAHFGEVGFKLGRWVDVGYWQRTL
jgi:L-amino acid N-acyltransferase YncA